MLSHSEQVQETIHAIRAAGVQRFHVLADFDRTLTRAYIDGVKAPPSVLAQVREGKYLTPDYAPQAHALFDKYAPLEKDQNLSFEERKAKMHEWWTAHFKLLVRSGFDKATIAQIVATRTIRFREGMEEFMQFLHQHHIPLVIMSAGPGDMITEHLRVENFLTDNVHVVANLYDWDDHGKAIKIREPIIHSLNKSDIALRTFPVFKEIEQRKTVLLLGDSIGDAAMIHGFEYDNLIKVAFLNQDTEKETATFAENFDVVLPGDPSMQAVNEMLENMFG